MQLSFIIILREPVSRMYSHARFGVMYVQTHKDPSKFSENSAQTTFEVFANHQVDLYEECERGYAHLPSNEIWEKCTVNSKQSILVRSMYDYQISHWMEMFAHESFCIVSQEHLLNQQREALNTVSDFIGLSPFDWSSAENTNAHSLSPDGPKTSEQLPIEQETLTRLHAFFQQRGTKYWDIVQEHGFHGCRPRALQ